jgi:uncharacterized protein
MKRMLLTSLFAAIAAASLPAQTSVWKITRNGNTLYLGGTIHVLRPADLPLPAEYDAAFAAAGTVYFENDIGRISSPETQATLLRRGRYAGGATLQQALSPEAWAAVEEYCNRTGLSVAAINNFKPWMFAIMLAGLELQKLGITAEGIDMHYFKKAEPAGKSTHGLEPFEQHLEYLTTLGEGHENEMILHSLADLAGLKKTLADLLAAWRTGDLARIDALMLADLRTRFPSIHEVLIVRRNKAWLTVIEELIKSRGTELVLVGAGHLAGEDGLITELEKRGYAVERLVAAK